MSVIARTVGWLVPADERGDSIIGDFEEMFAGWQAGRGAWSAWLYLAWELVQSVPSLAWSAVAERGLGPLALRSLPALLVGYLVVTAPLGFAGQPPGVAVVVIAGLIGCASIAFGAGWLTAAVAGAAPRQHGFLLALGLATLGIGSALSPSFDEWAWYRALFLVILAPVAAYAGAGWWYRTHAPRRIAPATD